MISTGLISAGIVGLPFSVFSMYFSLSIVLEFRSRPTSPFSRAACSRSAYVHTTPNARDLFLSGAVLGCEGPRFSWTGQAESCGESMAAEGAQQDEQSRTRGSQSEVGEPPW